MATTTGLADTLCASLAISGPGSSGNRIPNQAQRVAAQTGNFRNNIFLDTSQRICLLLGCCVRRRVFPQCGRWAGPSIPLDTLFNPIRPIQIYSGSRSSKPAGRI
jgi:hypothetical protein